MRLFILAFALLLVSFPTKILSQNNELRCQDFKNGTFEQYIDTMRIETIRIDSLQVEKTRFGEAKYSVKWNSDCEYELELLSTSMIFLKDKIGRKYQVTITEMLGNKYNFKCIVPDKDFVYEGTLKKIK